MDKITIKYLGKTDKHGKIIIYNKNHSTDYRFYLVQTADFI